MEHWPTYLFLYWKSWWYFPGCWLAAWRFCWIWLAVLLAADWLLTVLPSVSCCQPDWMCVWLAAPRQAEVTNQQQDGESWSADDGKTCCDIFMLNVCLSSDEYSAEAIQWIRSQQITGYKQVFTLFFCAGGPSDACYHGDHSERHMKCLLITGQRRSLPGKTEIVTDPEQLNVLWSRRRRRDTGDRRLHAGPSASSSSPAGCWPGPRGRTIDCSRLGQVEDEGRRRPLVTSDLLLWKAMEALRRQINGRFQGLHTRGALSWLCPSGSIKLSCPGQNWEILGIRVFLFLTRLTKDFHFETLSLKAPRLL